MKAVLPNGAPRREQPAAADVHASPPPAPPPAIHVDPLLANQVKQDLDGKSLCIAGRGHLMEFSVLNVSAGTRYLLLFDSETTPSNGARPRRSWTLTTLQNFDGIWAAGRPFNSGVCLALSSTQTSLTLVTAAEAIMEASFRI